MKRFVFAVMAAGLLVAACGGGEPPTAQPAPGVGAGPAGSPGESWTRPADGMTMVYVPAGEYAMGLGDEGLERLLQVLARVDPGFSREGWMDHLGEEQPAHPVAVDGFWIDRTEVTNDQYRRCTEAGPCRAPTKCDRGEGAPTFRDRDKADHPVVCVDWHDAQAYCAWVGGRLPTEAEWEVAARGGQDSLFPWGDDWGEALDRPAANLCDANCPLDHRDAGYDDGYARTAPAGSYPEGASWCGALDMAGNVAEWVQDWHQWDYYRLSPRRNPPGPDQPDQQHKIATKVRRGGGWDYPWIMVRVTDRSLDTPEAREAELGFRCVLAVDR
jgi:formylglycine-generating enzyme required for sulfatase activity